MKQLLLSVILASLGIACGGIQIKPTCQLEEYGIIQFVNASDDFKDVAVFRLYFDKTAGRYKTVGKPHFRVLEPMITARLRLHPGVVLVVVDKINRKRWVSEPMIIRTCVTSHVDLEGTVYLQDVLESRRQGLRDCPPCPECFLGFMKGKFIKYLLESRPRMNRVS